MKMLGHPRHDLDGEYRIIQVNHAGNQPQALDQDASGEFSYSNEFTVTERGPALPRRADDAAADHAAACRRPPSSGPRARRSIPTSTAA
jgi:uncharacterized protein involved in type VI secretion and phage assembly